MGTAWTSKAKHRAIGHQCAYCGRYGVAGFSLSAGVWHCANAEDCGQRIERDQARERERARAEADALRPTLRPGSGDGGDW